MTDFADLILRNLETLKGYRESNSLSANEGNIVDIIKIIRENCLSIHLKDQERESVIAHIFSEDYGLVTFLRSLLPIKEHKTSKQDCFKLLDDILDQNGQQIQEYGSSIQEVCSLYLKQPVVADLKKASLVTLSKVLEACQGFQGEKKIDVNMLIQDLFFQLSLGTKLTPTGCFLKRSLSIHPVWCKSKDLEQINDLYQVKEGVLCLIGVIAHYYPEDFIPYQGRVLSVFLQELNCQINARTPSYNIIAGCLLGLKEYLFNFSVLYSEAMDRSYKIFDIARKMIDIKKFSTKTSPACRAGLQLLASHAPQFGLFIFENCIELYKELFQWILHKNRDLQKLGQNAIVSKLKVVSEMLMTKFTEDKNFCMKVFKFFMDKFQEIFLSSSSSKALYIAIIGYGLFAGPCKICLDENDVKTMFQTIIQKCEHIFFSETDDLDDKIMRLSTYIESLASIIAAIDYMPENIIFTMEKLVVFQIDKYPKVPSAYNFVVAKAIIRILLSVLTKKELFLGFLNQIIYQGIVKTCSHCITVEAEAYKDNKPVKEQTNQYELEQETSVKIITYKDYVSLWKNILGVVRLKELNVLGIPLEDRQYLMESVYDEIIKSSLKLINQLDLNLQSQSKKDGLRVLNEESDVSSDQLQGLHPNNITDYYIFINLVDFLRDLLNETCTELFSKWVYAFGSEMIFCVSKYPYHSGFYKLTALTLSICSEIGYFKNISYELKVTSFERVCADKSSSWRSFQLFSKFVKEVLIRQQQFKDDLLASCLEVLLVLPIEIVVQEINSLVPALENALKLGMSYLPLAKSAVCALEKWSLHVPLDTMKPHLPRLLPHLNSYISASRINEDNSAFVAREVKRTTKKVHKMSAKTLKRPDHYASKNLLEDPALLKLQLRILRFLGRLGGHNVALLEKAYEEMDEHAIAWDTLHRTHLKYSVPFMDMKPDIYFDDFLPRILEIATKSSVRQDKVAACEALHSLVLYLIGRGSQMPEDFQVKFSMEALYEKLFPGLLELACDVEQVTKQLFHPLVLQIIHWFTCRKVNETPESAVILNSLWDGVTHQQNTALRDFSALCLKEYFLWSLKQSSRGKQISAENLLKKLQSLSIHPSPFKRMGAALTFNNIYTIFREEDALIKKYSLQLLVQFVNSLAIADNDDKSLGTQSICVSALNHIENILCGKYKYFLKTDASRKKPVCLKEATLESATNWLLKQCGCIQSECRHKCMDLVVKFCVYLPEIKNAATFLLAYEDLGKSIFEDVFEQYLSTYCVSKSNVPLTYKHLILWLKALLASLDCYHWAFSENLFLDPAFNGTKCESLLSSVKIFSCLDFFIRNIAKENLQSIMNAKNEKASDVYTAQEIFRYNRLKCTVLVRLFNFIISVFEDNAKWFHHNFMEILWNSSLWEIFLLSIIDPSAVGFDMTDPEVYANLPNELSLVLKTFLSRKSDFSKFCGQFIFSQEKYNLLKLVPINLQYLKHDPIYLTELLNGHIRLLRAGIFTSDVLPECSREELMNSLLDSVWNDCTFDSFKKDLSPVTFKLAEKLLSLCFTLGLKADALALRLLYPSEKDDGSKISKNKGLILMNIFANTICTFVSQSPSQFVGVLASYMHKDSFCEVSILIKFIDYVACTKLLRRKHGKGVIECYLSYWNQICEWWSSHSENDSSYSVLSIVTKMLLIDSKVALNICNDYSSSLLPTYITLLQKKGVTTDILIRALDILPFFLDVSEDNHLLRLCLEEMLTVHFPLKSKDLKPGTVAYHSYISFIKQMLCALKLTGCEFLLEIMMTLFCKEENHVLEVDFQSSIIFMLKRMDPKRQMKTIDMVYGIILADFHSSEVRLAIIEKVITVMMENISVAACINFFLAHIQSVMNILKEGDSGNQSGKDVHIVKKICCFKLLEMLYKTVSKDLLHKKDSHIVETYLGHEPDVGNELSTDITKLALEFKKRDYKVEPEYRELLRKLNCACYSTLIAVISCTQTDLKFYSIFLFKESKEKNEYIWERIIDSDMQLSFELELDISAQQQKFVSIRHTFQKESEHSETQVSTGIQSSLELFGSENLALSSLAEDVSKFVFSTNEPLFSSENADALPNPDVKEAVSESKKEKYAEDIVEMNDKLNQHECMISLSSLLMHMKQQGFISEEQSNTDIPAWLNSIIKNLEDTSVSRNVQLFLGRLIIKSAKILQPYAAFLLEPLMNLILMETVGSNLNYYVLDIIIVLLSWSSAGVPKGTLINEASKVLKFFINNCEHSRREIFRNNLEVIKTILECWKDGIKIPYDCIYEKMNNFDAESKTNAFGIQILGVIMSNGFPPYGLEEDATGQRYIAILLKNLSHKYKEVYGSAAEVIALVLKYLVKDEQNPDENLFFKKVLNQLESMKTKEDRFLYCLNKIHYGCPNIADKFIPRLLHSYKSLHGVYKNYILEILHSRVTNIQNGYKELKMIDLFDDLEKKNEDTQYTSLQMLLKLIPSMSCDDVLSILPGIVEIRSQQSSASRQALYKILFALFEKYNESAGAKEKKVCRYAHETLLIGLADPDQEIRLMIDNFWNDEKRLPSGTKDRLIALMQNMYSPITEESFLQYATYLLLERTSHSPDYKRKIFEHPLSQCNFQAYTIQTSWRKQHVAMSPLFTETASSSLSSSFVVEGPSKSFGAEEGLVKATQQNVEISEAVDTSIKKSETYNWLTEKSLDTYAYQDVLDDSSYKSHITSPTKSHLMILKRDFKVHGSAYHDSNINKDDKAKKKSSVWMLRRRFMKDRNNSDAYAKQELRRQDVRKEMLKEQCNRRDSQVVMYRQYRIGELPDIEISNSAVIVPVQALAMSDVAIAKLLMKSLLIGVCNAVKEDNPEAHEMLKKEIGCCFSEIISSSYLYTPAVITFCLESLNQLQDIKYNAEQIFTASRGSNQQSIGILLLESKLSRGFDSEPECKRMRKERMGFNDETTHWMKLAELYRSINDYDVVNGIFSLTMGHREENRKALQYESAGQFFDAAVLYDKLYEEASDQYDQAEKDFWDMSVLSCLDKLAKWENLEQKAISRFTDPSAPDLQQIWEDLYMKENYLPYLIRSKIKQLIDGKEDQSLLTFFDAARGDEEKRTYLEMHFSEELALLYSVQDKFDIARHYGSSCVNQFLKEWQNISPLAVEIQHFNLQKLIKFVELEEFLNLMKQDKCVDVTSTVKMLKIWQVRCPSAVDPVNIWDDVCSNRHLYLKKLEKEIINKDEDMEIQTSSQELSGNSLEIDEPESEDFKKVALETQVYVKLHFAETSAAQGNFPVAVSNLKKIYKVSKALEGSLWSKFIQAYCSINNQRISHFEPRKKLDVLLGSLGQLIELETRCGSSVSQKKLESQTMEIIANMFIDNMVTISSMSHEQKKKISELCAINPENSQIGPLILNKSFVHLKSVTEMSSGASKDAHQKETNSKEIASAHMELANFCNRYLRREADQNLDSRSIPSFGDFPLVLTESLLRALEYGYQEALQLFPRLLQIMESHPLCLQSFQKQVSKMPCWLFIGWINQMLALLDKPEAKAVQGIIENITLAYPDAIIYSFHLSYTNYKFNNPDGQMNKTFVERIKQILGKHTLIGDFVAALEHLSVPHVVFKEYISEITCLMQRKAPSSEMKCAFVKMYEDLFSEELMLENQRIPLGPLQKKIAEDFRADVIAICGKDGSKLTIQANQEATKKALTDLQTKMKLKDKKNYSLKDISPWLSAFQQWKYPVQIEIPGQYSGKFKPLPEYHVKVAGFDEKVLVLASVTSPRRITIRGNDEKEYKILVKSGEDLRQDARIQQMFSLLNEIYANDVKCARRHLGLRMYKVIPLSTRLGLIEWIDNIVVLNEFLNDGMSLEERKSFFKKNGACVAQEKLMQFIKFEKKSVPDAYALFYMNKTRDECVKKFEEIVNLVPRNLLTKSFLKLSSSPEAFIALRTKYAASHAVICISQWIVGIGDRHLGNFLIDKKSGCEVGIDFGHAFGSATQFLPVPELVPFRLSPQYLQLMDPLKVKGIYEATMIHVLSAARSKRDLLLNIMDIFIKEPTLDWKVHAHKQKLVLGIIEEADEGDWFPKQRINIARRKLEGINPCYATREELRLGHGSKSIFRNLESICIGDSKYNIRARLGERDLTVEEQVDCLIDQATDPYILCSLYLGWKPWM